LNSISIITTSFNSASTIADTLQSVADQSFKNIEHIIVDGGSKDGTQAIVKKFPHVKQLISERDQGLYDAMNKGIKAARGEYVAILNSDDIYTGSEIIAKAMHLLESSGKDTLYGDLQYVSSTNLNKVIRTWRSGAFRKNNFYFGWMPPHPTFIVRREIYDEIGNFNTTLRSAADYEMMLRILFKHDYTAAYLPEVMVKMRTGGMSNASFQHRLSANREDRRAWQINNLQPYFFTHYAKPARKVFQYLIK
jgi:glycosyltransferase involved in cell wall biosynthesis